MRTGRHLARFVSSGSCNTPTYALTVNPPPHASPFVDSKSRCYVPREVAPCGWQWAAAGARGLLRRSAVWLCAALPRADALNGGTSAGASRQSPAAGWVQAVANAISTHFVSCVEPAIAVTLSPVQVLAVAGLLCNHAYVMGIAREHATKGLVLEPDEKVKLAGYLRRALQETKPIRPFSDERQKAAVAVFYALFDPDAASPPPAADTALKKVFAWMTEPEVGNLLDRVERFEYVKDGRRYFAKNQDRADRELYIEIHVSALMTNINQSYLKDWEVRWDDAAFDKLLRSVRVTAADLWVRPEFALTGSLAQFDRRVIFSSIVDFHPGYRFVAPESETLVNLLRGYELESMSNALWSHVCLMTGESGSGKTVTALQVAAREGRLVLFLKAEDVFKADSDGVADRNVRVITCLEKAVDRNVNPQNLPIEASPLHLTVVIDDMGGYPEELQGVCATSCFVVDAIMRKLKVASVQLICVGTRLVASHPSGSQPHAFRHFEMRPFLWQLLRPTLTEDIPKDTKDATSPKSPTSPKRRMLALLLDGTKRHPELVWIRELLQNARFTALFMERLRTAFAPPYSQDKVSVSEASLIGGLLFLAQQALLRHFELSGLKHQTFPHARIRDALQLMLDRSRVGVNWSDNALSFGIATCSAVVVKGPAHYTMPGGEPVNPRQKDNGTGVEMMYIDRAYVHVSSAYCAMFLVLVGGASPRPLTPTVIEQAIADYATVCASLADIREEVLSAEMRRVPQLRQIITSLGVPLTKSDLRVAGTVPLATVHASKVPIDYNMIVNAPDPRLVLWRVLQEAKVKQATASVVINGLNATNAKVLVMAPKKLVLIQCISDRDVAVEDDPDTVTDRTGPSLRYETVCAEFRKMVPLYKVDKFEVKGKEKKIVQTFASLPHYAHAAMNAFEAVHRQRTTEALIEAAAGKVFVCDEKDNGVIGLKEHNDPKAQPVLQTHPPVSAGWVPIRRKPLEKTSPHFVVDLVMAYEGAAAINWSAINRETGAFTHPDVGATELDVEYEASTLPGSTDDSAAAHKTSATAKATTPFVVRFRYFVLDLTWRRAAGRSGSLDADEPLPPLYPVVQSVFPPSNR